MHNTQAAIDEAVVYKVASPTYERAQGLSIYMPFGEQINDVDEYYNVASLEDYEQYVDGYVAKLRAMDEGINFVSDISEETEEIPSEDPNSGDEFDQQQIFSVQVAEEDIDRVAELYSVLAMYEEPGSSNLIYLGYDADVSFDTETGMITDNFTGNWVLLDNQFVSMYLEEETEDYLKYSIPAKLNDEEVNIIVLFDFSQGNDEAYAEIIGATGLVDENNMADKNLIDIVPGDIITPLYETYNIDTEEAGTIEGEPFEVTDELVLMEAELPPGEYLYGFYALDFAGNESFSEYVNLQIDEGEETDDGIEKVWDQTTNTDVSQNKVWTVSFNAELDEDTVTSDAIYVVDVATNEIIPTELIIGQDGKSVEVHPVTPYEVGSQYKLIVTNNVQNINGQAIAQSIKMYFDIVE